VPSGKHRLFETNYTIKEKYEVMNYVQKITKEFFRIFTSTKEVE